MIPVKILAVRYLANAAPSLALSLGAEKGRPSLGMLTTDCDDATYIALDAATKAADVEVAYGRSLYAGSANASPRVIGTCMVVVTREPGITAFRISSGAGGWLRRRYSS